MSRAWTRGAFAAAALSLTAAAVASPAQAGLWDDWKDRRHTIFVGAAFGTTNVQPANERRQVEGIDFRFTTDERDLGWALSAGYWITDAVGLEAAYWGFGTVDVPFTFEDPHDNSSGTGESEITFSGPSLSLVVGHDFGDFRVFGRAGALFWTRDMATRFDVPGEPALHRDLSETGTGLTFGGGAAWRFHRSWSLVAQFQRAAFEDDTIDLMTLGLEYDFTNAILAR